METQPFSCINSQPRGEDKSPENCKIAILQLQKSGDKRFPSQGVGHTKQGMATIALEECNKVIMPAAVNPANNVSLFPVHAWCLMVVSPQ